MTAFVFSGQGAQKPGMGKDLYERSKKAAEVFDLAEKLRPGIKKLCFEGTKEELGITVNTQPCVFTVDLAAACAMTERGIIPDITAGFSLGEIAALAFAGALQYEDAFRLVCKRAEFMHEEAENNEKGKGAMAAILGLSAQEVSDIAKTYETVEAVNYNCPGQTVVSGLASEIEAFLKEMKEKGAKARLLAVSGAFHSRFMDKASRKMSEYLKHVKVYQPEIGVYSNLTAAPYGGSEEAIKKNIVEQINHAVKWEASVRAMIKKGANAFVEAGEGKVLCGLIEKIDPSVTVTHYTDILNNEMAGR